ncbi:MULTISPECIES: pyruvate dehydrogenase complex dihydrolipoamide acetyltransferase [unclassified Sphingomonas]|uniref:pyruvate dehydrogenase complex dihydrolipoamide acetyltransferase n=1 Tax=unclassified Sphingomonas TaxID=196159 RepID=UPI0006FDC118|nr:MULTISPECIES: pyruvate dehydrogenase complex dihydrolipoamide acetyltransferase [unclassified Sphingomonas]KQM57236.1 branched-chain alpha-keto acid dehydrogenase subunit E2 [Sphingomonas sp. Leaf16]KQN10411.1 branched-chain alpha-keto acid dehydrogenase subunit E2 [Sphingomonas sp. Leaf29]KQN18211.1 branched-chain alpha-keto acid dehydrogenase subunit E2 [Sphingomonas sp. Leaf32]
MPIEIKMPALSPTMEEGTLAKWLVKEGDTVKSGDIMAEIETDKATMEFEAVDEGTIGKVLVAEGTDNVKVGAVIAILLEEGEDASAIGSTPAKADAPKEEAPKAEAPAATEAKPAPAAPAAPSDGSRVKASPLARRIAADKGLDLSGVAGSGPNGRIVKADVESAKPGAASAPKAQAAAPASQAAPSAPAAEAPKPAAVWFDDSIPHTVEKLSNIRKTIARRLTESKQQVPHIYLTVDIRLDALLKLRGDLNKSLDARGVKLSVNDLLIKALGVALENSPKCNVTFLGNEMVQYARADVSVAVSTPTGLITPIIRDAANKGVAKISSEMKDLAGRAKENKLKPEEYQGGTASLSNMGMFGIKQFEAVINPPQGMILAVGAGEKRPYIVDDALGVATVMTATGSFDHRAIDGADGAEMLKLFKALVESPLGLIA